MRERTTRGVAVLMCLVAVVGCNRITEVKSSRKALAPAPSPTERVPFPTSFGSLLPEGTAITKTGTVGAPGGVQITITLANGTTLAVAPAQGGVHVTPEAKAAGYGTGLGTYALLPGGPANKVARLPLDAYSYYAYLTDAELQSVVGSPLKSVNLAEGSLDLGDDVTAGYEISGSLKSGFRFRWEARAAASAPGRGAKSDEFVCAECALGVSEVPTLLEVPGGHVYVVGLVAFQPKSVAVGCATDAKPSPFGPVSTAVPELGVWLVGVRLSGDGSSHDLMVSGATADDRRCLKPVGAG